jgi:Family of unknown function (DUF5719)
MNGSSSRSLSAQLRRPAVSVAVAAIGLVALVGTATLLSRPVVRVDTTAVVQPVASAELVCPVTTASDVLTSTVSAGVASLPSVSKGIATLADLSTKATATPPQVIPVPGRTVTRVIAGKSGPALLARATGSFSAGFGADQTIRSGQGASRGLAVSPCARPVTDAWLVGGGTTVGRTTQVLLVNDDDRPATVDLLVYGPKGQVDAPGGAGIVLAASSRRQVRLDVLAPGLAVVAVHVVARSGRIGVSGLDQQANGLIPLGMSLLPATQAGRHVVIPNIPSPVHSATLDLLAPDADTTVSLTLLTDDGPISPAGIDHVRLVAGRVTTVDLTAVLAGLPAGLVVTADTPVAAGIEVRTGEGGDLKEKDTAAGTPALTAPGIVVGLVRNQLTHKVIVAAPTAAAQVRFALFVPGRQTAVWTQDVAVPRGAVRRVTIPVTTKTPTSILVVTPVSGGPVYAGRQVTEAGARGPMVALAPIYPLRATTLVPAVLSAPGSSLSGTAGD